MSYYSLADMVAWNILDLEDELMAAYADIWELEELIVAYSRVLAKFRQENETLRKQLGIKPKGE